MFPVFCQCCALLILWVAEGVLAFLWKACSLIFLTGGQRADVMWKCFYVVVRPLSAGCPVTNTFLTFCGELKGASLSICNIVHHYFFADIYLFMTSKGGSPKSVGLYVSCYRCGKSFKSMGGYQGQEQSCSKRTSM